jgi:hypothetical protein
MPNTLRVITATYLGGSGAEAAGGVVIAPDGSLVVAGAFPGYAPSGVPQITVPGFTTGAVVRLSPNGRELRSVTRIGGTLKDVEINDAGQLVVCGVFGVAMLNGDASSVTWSATPGAVDRCAVGSDGTTAVLVDNAISVYSAAGTALGNWTLAGTDATDVAVDGAGASVIASGYTQATPTLQIPYLRAFAYDGTLRWRSYDFADAPGLGADTRAERVAIGADGKLYMAGSINGGTGVSVFSRDPKDLSIALDTRLAVIDRFTNPFNTGSVKIGWFGRFNPADGTLERAQSLVTRLSSDRGNSISIKELTADSTGRIFIVGDTACCIRDRDGLLVNGITPGAYESGEGFFLALSADFLTRRSWVVFTAPGVSGGGSPLVGVATRGNSVALAGTFNTRAGTARGLITVNALQPSFGGTAEAYLVVAPKP